MLSRYPHPDHLTDWLRHRKTIKVKLRKSTFLCVCFVTELRLPRGAWLTLSLSSRFLHDLPFLHPLRSQNTALTGVACIKQKHSKESIFTLTMPKINEHHIVAGCEGGGFYYCPWPVSAFGLTLINGTALHHGKASGIILTMNLRSEKMFFWIVGQQYWYFTKLCYFFLAADIIM